MSTSFQTQNDEEIIRLCALQSNYDIIENSFYEITPSGQESIGVEGLINWAFKRKLNIKNCFDKYILDLQKYNSYFDKNGLINASQKTNNSQLDNLYYCDFYTHGNFGKTKLGALTFYGKSGPNPSLIKNAIEFVKPKILNFIKTQKIDAVGFVAPTNERSIQILTELEKSLNLNLPQIQITKIITPVKVAQKTLKTMEDRITNASTTFHIESKNTYSNILLIDDLVGSGSTLEQIAKKIRNQGLSIGKITGIAIVGSENGIINTSKKFEVVVEA